MAKKTTRKKRNARLTVVPSPANQKQCMKSALIDNNDTQTDVSSLPGRKGYAEKCKQAGIFVRVSAHIRDFRTKNPDTSFMDLYKELHSAYSFIFDKDPNDMYGNNFQKVIEAEPAWCNAYYTNRVQLVELARQRVCEVLEKDSIDDATAIRAYDTVMKYEVADNSFSDEDNEITFGFFSGE